MRTESTFSFGAFALDIALAPAVELVAELEADPEDLSTVPVISTLWPTCGLSFESSASRRYVLPDGVVAAPPAVPVAVLPVAVLPVAVLPDADAPDEPELDAFVRMNLASLELGVVLPVVPVAPEVALAESR